MEPVDKIIEDRRNIKRCSYGTGRIRAGRHIKHGAGESSFIVHASMMGAESEWIVFPPRVLRGISQRAVGFVRFCYGGLEYVDGLFEYDELLVQGTDNGLSRGQLALTNLSFFHSLFLSCPWNLERKIQL
uniref:Uncharacterized protein n=1 Tax=Arundo donax TaxID=35708 RepID=A0A0A9DCE3_ARUDO